nr:YaiO family outer membrane beta-barrel protein [uncultured Holophaga sp.]
MKALLATLLISTALQGQSTGVAPTFQASLGGSFQGFTGITGPWRSWSLGGAYLGDPKGPWTLDLLGFDRPEGNAALLALGRQLSFGQATWVAAHLAAGAGKDYLPRFRAEADMNLTLSGPWGLGLMGGYSAYTDGISSTLLQAGPSYTGITWALSARWQVIRYNPEGGSDGGAILDLRRQNPGGRGWHSLRLAWGHGIVESTQGTTSLAGPTGSPGGASGGGFGQSPGGGNGSGRVWLRSQGSTGTTGDLPTEALASLFSEWPLGKALALRTEAAWGGWRGGEHFWSGSAQLLCRF